MMKGKKNIWILLIFSACLFSCNGCGEKKEMSNADIEKAQQELIRENKKIHEREMKTIARYIRDQKWPMVETKTGLQYWIYETGNGPKALPDDIAFISYTISLLDGTVCYVTKDDAPKQVRVGHDNVETGLHEALQLMHAGDKAKLILPSHLAFGFTGDSGKIPQNATVIYDIHLIDLR